MISTEEMLANWCELVEALKIYTFPACRFSLTHLLFYAAAVKVNYEHFQNEARR